MKSVGISGECQTLGTIEQIDLLCREVTVATPEGTRVFDVPPGCPVLLHGERIKLRLAQPGDQVAITFSPRKELPVARLLKVQPNQPGKFRSAADKV